MCARYIMYGFCTVIQMDLCWCRVLCSLTAGTTNDDIQVPVFLSAELASVPILKILQNAEVLNKIILKWFGLRVF